MGERRIIDGIAERISLDQERAAEEIALRRFEADQEVLAVLDPTVTLQERASTLGHLMVDRYLDQSSRGIISTLWHWREPKVGSAIFPVASSRQRYCAEHVIYKAIPDGETVIEDDMMIDMGWQVSVRRIAVSEGTEIPYMRHDDYFRQPLDIAHIGTDRHTGKSGADKKYGVDMNSGYARSYTDFKPDLLPAPSASDHALAIVTKVLDVLK